MCQLAGDLFVTISARSFVLFLIGFHCTAASPETFFLKSSPWHICQDTVFCKILLLQQQKRRRVFLQMAADALGCPPIYSTLAG